MTYRGNVTRVDGNTVYVEVPELNPGQEYECEVLDVGYGVTSGVQDGHTHVLRPALARDDRVLVQTVAGVEDDLVIVGRIAG